MNMHKKVRAGLARTLRNVRGIGVVHAYERFSVKEKDFRDHYTRDGQLLGWHIRRGVIKEAVFDTQYNRVRIKWHIRGLAALVDAKASELILDSLVDAICQEFRRTPELKTVHGRAYARTKSEEGAGIQVEESGPVMFAGVLCHSVRLSLMTEHFEEIEPDLSEHANPCPRDTFCLNLSIFPSDLEWRTIGVTDSASTHGATRQAESGLSGSASVLPQERQKGEENNG